MSVVGVFPFHAHVREICFVPDVLLPGFCTTGFQVMVLELLVSSFDLDVLFPEVAVAAN